MNLTEKTGLLAGQLHGQGSIVSSLPFDYFPFPADSARPAREALIDTLAPYTLWEKEMAACLAHPTPQALARYGEVEEAYAARDGYRVRDDLAREAQLLASFLEMHDGTVKVSLRARPGFDVAWIAGRLGGGGHVQAAGFSFTGTLEEAQRLTLALLCEERARRRNEVGKSL